MTSFPRVFVHDRRYPFLHPQLERRCEIRKQIANDLRFCLSKIVEHEVGEVADLTLLARMNSDAQSRILLRSKRPFDALQAIVPAGAAFAAKAVATDRQRNFVDDD